jgi:hypothetical protein
MRDAFLRAYRRACLVIRRAGGVLPPTSTEVLSELRREPEVTRLESYSIEPTSLRHVRELAQLTGEPLSDWP